MRATVAQVTAEEPATAAMMPHPKTFTCNKRPGSQFTQGARPLNISSDKRVRNKISPIQMNRGNAVMGQPQLASHMAEIIIEPVGVSENTASAKTPTDNNPRAIQIPLANSTNKTAKRMAETMKTEGSPMHTPGGETYLD